MSGGLWGKLPSRGDFVRIGLARGFTDPWDAWLSGVLVESRAALGESWLSVWLVAPIWRFCLAAGVCGPDAMLGVWMPSVDNAGRHYPLTLAVSVPTFVAHEGAAVDWLDAAEEAGLAALGECLEPDVVVARLPALGSCEASAGRVAWTPERRGVWGGGHAPPSACLPTGSEFAAMLA